MQKAITIIGIEEGLSHEKREKFRRFIHEKNAPLVRTYDDDDAVPGDDLEKVTIQIKEQLDGIEEKLDSGFYFDSGAKEKRTKKRGAASKSSPVEVDNIDSSFLKNKCFATRTYMYVMTCTLFIF